MWRVFVCVRVCVCVCDLCMHVCVRVVAVNSVVTVPYIRVYTCLVFAVSECVHCMYAIHFITS